MSRWQNESAYIRRYAGGGALNSAVGFSIIFLLMWLGASPFTANILGYLVGLILGFFVSKKFVFRSEGRFSAEAARYLAAFFSCLVSNLFMLWFALNLLRCNANLAQLLAALVYTVFMYLLARWLVFDAG